MALGRWAVRTMVNHPVCAEPGELTGGFLPVYLAGSGKSFGNVYLAEQKIFFKTGINSLKKRADTNCER